MTPQSILNWATQLVALHHPFIAEGGLMELVEEFQIALTADHLHHPNSVLTMSFCIGAAVLHSGSAAMSDDSSQAHLHNDGRYRKIMTAQPLRYCADIPMLFACALLSSRGAVFRQIPPPSPNKMAFQHLFDISMPFCGEELFMHAHILAMISRPFLESGEWWDTTCTL
jgi:hypothetical protein